VIGERLQKLYAAVLMVGLFALGYGLSWINWTQPVGEKLFVSLIQANIPQEDKWLPEFRNEHIQKHIDLMEPRINSSHLIIWPETAIFDTFQQSMEDVVNPLQEVFKAAETDLLMGGFQHEKSTESMYNAIMSVRDLEVYGKRHLVPFSEYTPFLEYLRWMEDFIMLPYSNVAPWKGKVNLQVAGQPMRMSVCYEDAYGEEMIDGLPEATMLVNVSNDGWFTGSIEPAQHAQLARFRALETGRYLLRATNNGVSAIVNEKGKIVTTGPQYEAVVVEEFAQPMQGSTPYIRWGNWFLMPLLAITLIVVGWLGRGKFR
jgi:apolipoprotein N-acyltransferase